MLSTYFCPYSVVSHTERETHNQHSSSVWWHLICSQVSACLHARLFFAHVYVTVSICLCSATLTFIFFDPRCHNIWTAVPAPTPEPAICPGTDALWVLTDKHKHKPLLFLLLEIPDASVRRSVTCLQEFPTHHYECFICNAASKLLLNVMRSRLVNWSTLRCVIDGGKGRESAALLNRTGPRPIDLLIKKTQKQKEGFRSQWKDLTLWGWTLFLCCKGLVHPNDLLPLMGSSPADSFGWLVLPSFKIFASTPVQWTLWFSQHWDLQKFNTSFQEQSLCYSG